MQVGQERNPALFTALNNASAEIQSFYRQINGDFTGPFNLSNSAAVTAAFATVLGPTYTTADAFIASMQVGQERIPALFTALNNASPEIQSFYHQRNGDFTGPFNLSNSAAVTAAFATVLGPTYTTADAFIASMQVGQERIPALFTALNNASPEIQSFYRQVNGDFTGPFNLSNSAAVTAAFATVLGPTYTTADAFIASMQVGQERIPALFTALNNASPEIQSFYHQRNGDFTGPFNLSNSAAVTAAFATVLGPTYTTADAFIASMQVGQERIPALFTALNNASPEIQSFYRQVNGDFTGPFNLSNSAAVTAAFATVLGPTYTTADAFIASMQVGQERIPALFTALNNASPEIQSFYRQINGDFTGPFNLSNSAAVTAAFATVLGPTYTTADAFIASMQVAQDMIPALSTSLNNASPEIQSFYRQINGDFTGPFNLSNSA